MELKERASGLLRRFKGDCYAFGLGVLGKTAEFAVEYGRKALVIANIGFLKPVVDEVLAELAKQRVGLAGDRIVPDAAPNAPREDVYRIESYILHYQPDVIIAAGGGSTIDAAKAANALAALGMYSPEIDTYFGTGLVTGALVKTGTKLRPLIAVETAASSGAHLTKYANVTDPVAGQKKLIVDEAIIPPRSVFDYSVTTSMPPGLTADGALDGIAHCLEVFYGIGPKEFDLCGEIASAGLELAVRYTRAALENPADLEAREALGLATDLGGYAIMLGGTNGAHLTSFSLVDVASHGRACGLMNPYYTVFFAPAIQRQLRLVGDILKEAGFITTNLTRIHRRDLGVAVAEGLIAFEKSIGAPTALAELPGFTEGHISRALAAAKNPQLEMKLRNMPVPMHAKLVDEYMEPILLAAMTGNLGLIKNMP